MTDGTNNNTIQIVGEEEDQLNRRRTEEEARRYVDSWDAIDEQAGKEYDRMQVDLQRKLQESEEGPRQPQALQKQQNMINQQRAIAGPSRQYTQQTVNNTNLISMTDAPPTSSRINERPLVNHVPQQVRPTMSSTNLLPRNYTPTSAQQHMSTNTFNSNPNWTPYSSTTTPYTYPTPAVPSTVAAGPFRAYQPAPQQPRARRTLTHSQSQQQQPQIPQGQSLYVRPAQKPSPRMRQGSYPVVQPAVIQVPSKHQQGHSYPYLSNQHLGTQHIPHPSITKPSPFPHPPVGVAGAPDVTRQLNTGQKWGLDRQGEVPTGNATSPAILAQAFPGFANVIEGGGKGPTTSGINVDLSQRGSSSSNEGAPKNQWSSTNNPQTRSIIATTPAVPSLSVFVNPQIPGNSSDITPATAKLKAAVAKWAREGPPDSYYELPGTNAKFYKDKASKPFLLTPDKEGRYVRVGIPNLDERVSPAPQSAFGTTAPTYTDTIGRVPDSNNLPLVKQPTVYGSYGIPPSQPSATRVISLDTPQLVEPLNENPIAPLRTPKDADKTHLARDILRALTRKRPRPENVSSVSQEPSAKRHASDIMVGETPVSIIPNTVAQPSISISPLATLPQAQATESSHLPDVGHTLAASSRSVFQVQKQIPTTVQPSATTPEPTTSTKVVLPSPSTFNTSNVISLSHPTAAPLAFPVIPPHPIEKTPASLLDGVPGPSRPSSPQVEPTENQFPLPAAVPESGSDRGKTPLFLPSPSPSPPPGTVHSVVITPNAKIVNMKDETLKLKSVASERKKTKKSQLCYVLVPPLPEYVKRFKANQRGNSKEDAAWLANVPASDGFVSDDLQKEAVQLSCTRLSKRPCKLGGCDAILNSTQTLLDHISQQHRPTRARCQWPQCERQCRDSKMMFYHIRNHALVPLECAFKDCQESFRTPQQLVRHHEAIHRNSTLKPAATLIVPKLKPLPAAPKSLPAYMVEARQVQPSSIPKDRHVMIGPWVLRNISGPTNLKTKRYNAAHPLRSQNRDMERRPGNEPYDFMTFSSTNFSTKSSQPAKLPRLDDLPSALVSEMTNDGMVLWQVPEVKVEDPAVEISSNGPRAVTDELALRDEPNQTSGTRSPLSRGDDNHSEEEAVANILTG